MLEAPSQEYRRPMVLSRSLAGYPVVQQYRSSISFFRAQKTYPMATTQCPKNDQDQCPGTEESIYEQSSVGV
jgi:hypothetical protein